MNEISFDPNNLTIDIDAEERIWKHYDMVAKRLIESRAIPSYINNAAQALVVMSAGKEMGMRPMESIKYLYLINGQVALTGQGAARRIRAYGYKVDYEDLEDQCTVTISKDSKKISELTVTFEEAQKSGYTHYTDKQDKEQIKVGWREGMNRRLKLRYLALSTLIKTEVPEVLGAAIDLKEVAEDYVIPEMEKQEVVVTNAAVDTEQLKKYVQNSTGNEDMGLEIIRKKYFAVQKERGVSGEDAKEAIKKHFKVDSFNDITQGQLTAYINKVKASK